MDYISPSDAERRSAKPRPLIRGKITDSVAAVGSCIGRESIGKWIYFLPTERDRHARKVWGEGRIR